MNVQTEGFSVFLVMERPNVCLPGGDDKLCSFKKGLLVKKLAEVLAREGFVVVDTRQMLVCWVCGASMGTMSAVGAEWGTCWVQGPHDEYEWAAVTKGRTFDADDIIVKISLTFGPDDVPIGSTLQEYQQQWLCHANRALQPPSALQADLNAKGGFHIVPPIQEVRDIPDHPDVVASQEYRSKMDGTLGELEKSHNVLMDKLEGLRGMQKKIIMAIVSGAPYSSEVDSYIMQEQAVLQAATADYQTIKHHSHAETAFTKQSTQTAPPRPTHTNLRTLPCKPPPPPTVAATPLPSSHYQQLKALEHTVTPSSVRL